MPYQERETQHDCPVCKSPANVFDHMSMFDVRCSRCGDFAFDRAAHHDYTPIARDDARALASHLIKKLQGKHRPVLDGQFFARLASHSLPSPSELSDNLLLLIDQRVNSRPGAPVSVNYLGDLSLQASIGAVDGQDALWAVRNLFDQHLIHGSWQSHFTFFARKFANADLDQVYLRCLNPAVKQTGYDLQTVTQKAGHIDAIIEDEIRRCRFLIADLSDGQCGSLLAGWNRGRSRQTGDLYLSGGYENTLRHRSSPDGAMGFERAGRHGQDAEGCHQEHAAGRCQTRGWLIKGHAWR